MYETCADDSESREKVTRESQDEVSLRVSVYLYNKVTKVVTPAPQR